MAYQVGFHPHYPSIVHARFIALLSTQDFIDAAADITAMLEGRQNGPFGLIVDFSEAEDFTENLKMGELRSAAFNLPTSIHARVAVSPPLMAWLVIGILNRVTRAGSVAMADTSGEAITTLLAALGQQQAGLM